MMKFLRHGCREKWFGKFYEPLWLFRLRGKLFTRDRTRHSCGRRREAPPGPFGHTPGELPDYWETLPNGDRTCSYCGSLHEEDFLNLCRKALDEKNEVSIEPSDKGYKVYVRQPGVRNAADGGIKFYKQHISVDKVTPEIEKLYSDAVRVSNERWRKRFKA